MSYSNEISWTICALMDECEKCRNDKEYAVVLDERACDECIIRKAINALYLFEWVDVDEELPDEGVDLLVTVKTKNGIRRIDKGCYYKGQFEHSGISEVTHWMYMPELPAE